MLVLKLDKTIDGTQDIERKNMKELSILSILSKICIQNANIVLVLCTVIVELNHENLRIPERF